MFRKENARSNKKKCPICGNKFDRLLALSRADNKTMICDECGTMQALNDFIEYRLNNMRNAQ